MEDLLKPFLENNTNLFISAWLTVPLSIVFIYLYFVKRAETNVVEVFLQPLALSQCVYFWF